MSETGNESGRCREARAGLHQTEGRRRRNEILGYVEDFVRRK